MPDKNAHPHARVLIADDHAIMRKGLRDLIQAEADFEVCGESANGEDAWKKLEELKPSVLITDIDMPKMSGLDLASAIRKNRLNVDVILLTMYDDERFFTAAMDAGVKGYVLKDGAVTDIVHALKAVSDGKHYISPALSSFAIGRAQEHLAQLDSTSPLAALTLTERKVLRLISRNKSTKEIAEELFLSNRTIDTHRSHIAEKLNLHGPNALLTFAIQNKHKL